MIASRKFTFKGQLSSLAWTFQDETYGVRYMESRWHSVWFDMAWRTLPANWLAV